MTPAQITKQYSNLRARAKKSGTVMPFSLAEYREWYIAQWPDVAPCPYCGTRLATAKPEPDHAVPLARGGSADLSNMKLCCHRCNREKGELTNHEWEQVLRLMDVLGPAAKHYLRKKLYARPIYRR